jgi:hypothetical protein
LCLAQAARIAIARSRFATVAQIQRLVVKVALLRPAVGFSVPRA